MSRYNIRTIYIYKSENDLYLKKGRVFSNLLACAHAQIGGLIYTVIVARHKCLVQYHTVHMSVHTTLMIST
jgi:hypothetical protein